MFQELPNQFPSVPRSIMMVNRDELTDIKMNIEGDIPNDLQGHVFIVAPVGTLDSKASRDQDGDTYLNGDAMIYRLDFNQKGEVTLKTRLVRPPDYWADQETQENELLKFRNHGIVRFSYFLGSRNELNTAFLPMKFSGESNERLLITYDAGRPYEIDTETLEAVTPVGAITEWQAEVVKPSYPFNSILSTAHPAFDTYKHQMFTVNYGRNLGNILGGQIDRDYKKSDVESELPTEIAQLFVLLKTQLNNDFVYLICWDGVGSLKRWKLVNPDMSPVKIKQSMHQIGITEDYVVLMDTSFTTGIWQIINNPWPANKGLEEMLRELSTRKPSPDSILYIVRRDDLKEGQNSAKGEPEVKVVVQKVVIPYEACHFLVNYKNPGNKITLNIAHICAWDVAEWLRLYDRSLENHRPLTHLYGMQQSEMDISRMGRYVIDVNSQEPKIESQRAISDDTCTWGPGLFAYLDRLPSSGMTPEQIDNVYWVSFGLWKELTTDFMYRLYENYEHRQKPLAEVIELTQKGIPACLYRLHTSSNESMAIADYYICPASHMVLSPQFVPRSDGEESSTNGYIVCVAFTPERSEIWIFDAWDLKKGPRCKLHHPQLILGSSLHTAWLQNINSRQASYKIPVKQDYQDLVESFLKFVDEELLLTLDQKEDINKEIKELFEQKIYPHFE